MIIINQNNLFLIIIYYFNIFIIFLNFQLNLFYSLHSIKINESKDHLSIFLQPILLINFLILFLNLNHLNFYLVHFMKNLNYFLSIKFLISYFISL